MDVRQLRRLTAFGLLFSLPWTVFGQDLKDLKASVTNNKEPLVNVLSKLESKYKIRFAYNLDDISPIMVESSYNNVLLTKLLEEKGFKVSEHTGNIVVTKTGNEKRKQQRRINGVVRDEQNVKLGGVTIRVKGSTKATSTDEYGNFIIEAGKGDVLQLMLVGFVPKDVVVGESLELNIKLVQEQGNIDEVVVVGYGTQRRESVIGAITTIKPEVLQSNQTRSISNSLAGQVAGVIAVQRSGEPGYDNSDFWIRGINTFGANAAPLVLVDGIERSLNNISPEEIASFSILKDATATAVYGVRGANGVILIQTKRGKQGKPKLTFKTDYGISEPTKLPQFVGAVKYMETINAANILSGMAPSFEESRIKRTEMGYDPDLYANVNWMDAVTKPYSSNGRLSFDINGGSERLQYSLIMAYFTEKGMIVTDDRQNYDSQLGMKKYNLRSNVDLNLTSSTKVAVGIGGFINERRAPGVGISSILSRAMDTPPNSHPVVYSNGQIAKIAARYNPWSDATQTGYQLRFESNLETSVNVVQDIGMLFPVLEGLKGSVLASFDSYNIHNQKRTKTPRTFFATGRNEEGELITTDVDQGQEFLNYSRDSGGDRTIYFESRLNYNRTFGGKHNVDGLMLFNMRDFVDQRASTSILSLPFRNTGIAARSAYAYDNRYFAEFNFGYNGSENFRVGKRFGFFPSFAMGWMPSNEAFFEPWRATVSKLKLRGSWGLVGNDQLIDTRRFAYISTIDEVSAYSFGYTNNFNYAKAWREGDFGIADMTWETAEKLNAGLELGLWNNTVHIQADWFREKRRDIFMKRKTIPETAGFNLTPYANFGKVDNQGVEVEFLVNHQINKDWFLSARGNVTYAKNKVVEFDEPDNLKYSTRAQTGQSLNQHIGLIAEGLYQFKDFEDESKGILKEGIAQPMFGKVRAGDIKYRDLNKDGKVDAYDRAPIGKPYVPQTIVGFGLNTRYKNFDMGFLFQGATNFSNMLQGSTLVPGSGGGGTGNIYANVDDRWTPENPSSNVIWPRLSNIESSNNMMYSTWWLVDASYLRLKNMEVGYTLPKSTQQKMWMNNARVFLRGSNLLTFSYFKMWDPEIGSQNGLKYPLQRIISGGVDITF